MRFVIKNPDNAPEELINNNTLTVLQAIVSTKNKSLIQESLYKLPYRKNGKTRSKTEDRLHLTYLFKCAYCETFYKSDIEHYRPKKAVTNTHHDGYYWLCYEWTNLLPSCPKCNREGGKQNKFPVIGTRVLGPSCDAKGNILTTANIASQPPLLTEHPFLLHPEIDNPDEYLGFIIDPENEGIKIIGLDDDERGEKTIEICNLNRPDLKIARQNVVVYHFQKAVEATFALFKNDEEMLVRHLSVEIYKLHKLAKDETLQHTLLQKYIVKNQQNFENLVLPYLSEEIREIVLEAFIGYKSEFE